MSDDPRVEAVARVLLAYLQPHLVPHMEGAWSAANQGQRERAMFAAEDVLAAADRATWRPIAEGIDWGKIPGRVQVWLEGSTFHSGVEWRRSIWGECRHKGRQWHADDVERLRLIGDMEIWEVTHWRPYQAVPWPPGLEPPAPPEDSDDG